MASNVGLHMGSDLYRIPAQSRVRMRLVRIEVEMTGASKVFYFASQTKGALLVKVLWEVAIICEKFV